MAAPPTGRRVLETGKRLSQSLLWQILGDYYRKQALFAWKDSAVPYHVTSNPNIAHAYARVAFAFQQDLSRQGQTPAQPLPIVELGAGSGAFAFHFLKQLTQIRRMSPEPVAPFLYVMTDFSPATVDAWQHHPQLTTFLEAGILDFACFNPLEETSLILRHSGRVLSPAQPSPMLAIANYLFDSLPQDLFGVENGQIFEINVTLSAPQQEQAAEGWPALRELDVEYTYVPAASPYYEDAAFERVLAGYAGLDGEVVRFPSGALECCRTLRALAGDDLLLLTADRGFVHAEDLRAIEVESLFNVHDKTFSMPVNYHAVGEYLCCDVGDVLRPPRGHRSLCVTGFVTRPAAQCTSTHVAFNEYIARYGPDDASTLTSWISVQDLLPVSVLVSLLRFSRHDPLMFKKGLQSLRQIVEQLGDTEIDLLAAEMLQVWENYFHQGNQFNLPFAMAELMERLHRPHEAIFYYQHALNYYGSTPETLFNLAACFHKTGENQKALPLLVQAEALEVVGPALVQRHYRRRIDALRSAIQAQQTQNR